MKLFPVLFFLFLMPTLVGQSLTKKQIKTIDKLVMADIPEGGPGAAVAVIRDGEVVYEKYAGLADIKGERPITAATRFNIASCAKQFTSVRALQLIDEGKLRHEDDIRKYLPELYPDLETPVTIRHLINHTSGLRDMNSLWNIQGLTWWEEPFTNADVVTLLSKQRDLNFLPGSRHSYSNSNYILLAEIIARITGRSFKEDMDAFFQALKMPATNFRADASVTIPEMALPYFNFDTWQTYPLRAVTHGDGALFSTLRDQITWEIAVQTRQSPGISEQLLRTSQFPLDTVTEYGYGLENDKYRDTHVRYHDGSTGAWKASTLRFPDEKVTILVLNNSGKFGTNYLSRQIADVLLFPEVTKERFPTGPTTLGAKLTEEEILGVYFFNTTFFYRFVQRDGALFLERPNRNPVAVEWEAGNVFHEINDPAFKQAFTRNDEGVLEVTAYYPTHDPYTLTKVDHDWSDYDYAGLEGDYYNNELDVTIKVVRKEDKTFSIQRIKPKKKWLATIHNPDILAWKGGPIRFERDENGAVTGFGFSNDRIRNLRFVKNGK